MKAIAGVVAALGLVLLAGCASSGTARNGVAAEKQSAMTADERYVAQVERMARQRGTQVVWVNRPNKRNPATVASSD
jgi:hypothetical protein